MYLLIYETNSSIQGLEISEILGGVWPGSISDPSWPRERYGQVLLHLGRLRAMQVRYFQRLPSLEQMFSLHI